MPSLYVRIFIFVIIFFIQSLAYGYSNKYYKNLEKKILKEINLARQTPSTYKKIIENFAKRYQKKLVKLNSHDYLETEEGLLPVREVIALLAKQNKLLPLKYSKRMSRASRDHVKEQGRRGSYGHNDKKGRDFSSRLDEYLLVKGISSENISYGFDKARMIIIQFLIDDGVKSRGHRLNIFEKNFQYAGVACGKHKKMKTMCVIDFAEDIALKTDAMSGKLKSDRVGDLLSLIKLKSGKTYIGTYNVFGNELQILTSDMQIIRLPLALVLEISRYQK